MKLLKTKFKLERLRRKEIVIYDRVNSELMKSIIKTEKKESIITIDVRYETIYLFVFFSLYFYRILIKEKNLKIAYLAAIINVIKPKIVITNIDTNNWFYELSILFYKTSFFAIQNGNRFLPSDRSRGKVERYAHCYYELKAKYYPVSYLSIGEYEEFTYPEKCDFKFKQIIPVGSLRAAIDYYGLANYSIPICPEYDIGIIGSGIWGRKVRAVDEELCFSFLRELISNDSNLRTCFISKLSVENQYSQNEKEFIKYYFNGRVDYFSRNLTEKPNMFLASNCKVITGTISTLFREAYTFGIKIMPMNTIPSHELPNGQVSYNDFPKYEEFKSDFYKILSMERSKYFSKRNFEVLDLNTKDGRTARENIRDIIKEEIMKN